MKKYIALFTVLFLCVPLYAQQKVSLSYNPCLSLYNSENSTKTISGKNIDYIPSFSIAYENKHLLGTDIIIEYNYSSVKLSAVQEFRPTSSGPTIPPVMWTVDYYLAWHNIDFGNNYEITKWLSFSIGPSISLVYRTISIVDLYRTTIEEEVPATSFDDRLASICAGLNCSGNIEFPLQDNEQYFFLFSRIKCRYLHSVLFDSRGRNLGSYYQSFLSGQINIGVGYCF